MQRILLIAILVLFVQGCDSTAKMEFNRKELAKRWITGVYGSDPDVVDDLAGDDVIISYPVFKNLLGTPVVRGKVAAKKFASDFCSRWTDTHIVYHEVIEEGNRVVLIWSMKGTFIGSAPGDRSPTSQEHSWGGITLIRFNDAGKIIEDIGEESDPGPIARVSDDQNKGTDKRTNTASD